MNENQRQRILVFQQNGSGESKIQGIQKHGSDQFELEVVSIDAALPPIVDDPREYLPGVIDADLVLDFLTHPDLSYSLALLCSERGVPLIARGKKWRIEGTLTPPT